MDEMDFVVGKLVGTGEGLFGEVDKRLSGGELSRVGEFVGWVRVLGQFYKAV